VAAAPETAAAGRNHHGGDTDRRSRERGAKETCRLNCLRVRVGLVQMRIEYSCVYDPAVYVPMC
jgi:hypothetical protein